MVSDKAVKYDFDYYETVKNAMTDRDVESIAEYLTRKAQSDDTLSLEEKNYVTEAMDNHVKLHREWVARTKRQ